MPWLFFALSAVCFTIAFRTLSLGLAAVCLVLALGLLLAGALSLVSARIQNRSQSATAMLGPEQAALLRRRGAGPGAGAVAMPATGTAADRPSADAGDPARASGPAALLDTPAVPGGPAAGDPPKADDSRLP